MIQCKYSNNRVKKIDKWHDRREKRKREKDREKKKVAIEQYKKGTKIIKQQDSFVQTYHYRGLSGNNMRDNFTNLLEICLNITQHPNGLKNLSYIPVRFTRQDVSIMGGKLTILSYSKTLID